MAFELPPKKKLQPPLFYTRSGGGFAPPNLPFAIWVNNNFVFSRKEIITHPPDVATPQIFSQRGARLSLCSDISQLRCLPFPALKANLAPSPKPPIQVWEQFKGFQKILPYCWIYEIHTHHRMVYTFTIWKVNIIMIMGPYTPAKKVCMKSA